MVKRKRNCHEIELNSSKNIAKNDYPGLCLYVHVSLLNHSSMLHRACLPAWGHAKLALACFQPSSYSCTEDCSVSGVIRLHARVACLACTYYVQADYRCRGQAGGDVGGHGAFMLVGRSMAGCEGQEEDEDLDGRREIVAQQPIDPY